jgi:hypothetical protein
MNALAAFERPALPGAYQATACDQLRKGVEGTGRIGV